MRVRVRMHTWVGTCEVGERWGVSAHSLPRDHAKPDPPAHRLKQGLPCGPSSANNIQTNTERKIVATGTRQCASRQGTTQQCRGNSCNKQVRQVTFPREGLPWDRTFWRTSPSFKHWYHISPFILMSGTQSWGFPEIFHPSMNPICRFWNYKRKIKPVFHSAFNFLLMIRPYALPSIVTCRLWYCLSEEQRGQITFFLSNVYISILGLVLASLSLLRRRLSREISAECVFLAMSLASDEATKDVQGSNDSLVMPQSKLWPGTVGSANTHKSSAHVQIAARFSENSKTASESNLSFNPAPAWFMTSGGNHETRWLQPQTGGRLATPAQTWLCSVLKNWGQPAAQMKLSSTNTPQQSLQTLFVVCWVNVADTQIKPVSCSSQRQEIKQIKE